MSNQTTNQGVDASKIIATSPNNGRSLLAFLQECQRKKARGGTDLAVQESAWLNNIVAAR